MFLMQTHFKRRLFIFCQGWRVSALVECPSCGTEVATAVKSWPVAFRKQSESGALPQLCIGIFECPKCKSKFRSRAELTAKAEPGETGNVKDLVEKIKVIREGFVQTLKVLRGRMETLETERSTLLVEIEELKKVAESRADALENEVNQLREELKSLRELLASD